MPKNPSTGRSSHKLGLSLFWRTFFLLGLLLLGSTLSWLQALRAFDAEPHSLQVAEQTASLVNLSRAALEHSDAITRVSLIKTLAEQEGLRIVPREPEDRYVALTPTESNLRLIQTLTARLGADTIVASSVNDEAGTWIGFSINGDPNWLLLDRVQGLYAGGRTWLSWLVVALVLSLAGAAVIARLINQPLKELSQAANKVREGDFVDSQLDEEAVTSEIRAVNIGFNRMAQKLARLEQDRAVMLAGISHDLRTPLARLRLETEMSVSDDVARQHMVADIVQLDATIDKFLDYARPDHITLESVNLHQVVSSCVYAVQNHHELQISMDVADELLVQADEVELARVISNLLENARRYGKNPDTEVAQVDISCVLDGDCIALRVRDHGCGVPPEQLEQLVEPFFRSDRARTAAAGAGLGLSIVDKTVQRMGGTLILENASDHGLVAEVRLKRARVGKRRAEQRLQRPAIKRQLPRRGAGRVEGQKRQKNRLIPCCSCGSSSTFYHHADCFDLCRCGQWRHWPQRQHALACARRPGPLSGADQRLPCHHGAQDLGFPARALPPAARAAQHRHHPSGRLAGPWRRGGAQPGAGAGGGTEHPGRHSLGHGGGAGVCPGPTPGRPGGSDPHRTGV